MPGIAKNGIANESILRDLPLVSGLCVPLHRPPVPVQYAAVSPQWCGLS